MKDFKKMGNKEGRRFLVSINSSGGVDISLVFYLSSQFKFFSIKIDDETLDGAVNYCLNFEKMNYVDVSQQIRKGVEEEKSPSVLSYLFEDSGVIPSIVLKETGIKKETLSEKEVDRLVQ